MEKHYNAIFRIYWRWLTWTIKRYLYINIANKRCPRVLKVNEVQLELDINQNIQILYANIQYFKKYLVTFIGLEIF
jgi:hypothetical protein